MMTKFTYSDELFSDMHKDAYGFRPREYNEFWNATPERKQEIWDQTQQACMDSIEEDLRFEKAAADSFEATVAKFLAAGADSRETAIRWIISTVDADDLRYEADFVRYLLGLPHSYLEEVRAGMEAHLATLPQEVE